MNSLKDPLQQGLEEIQELAAKTGGCIYNICYRNAGVGIQFFEEKLYEEERARIRQPTNWKASLPPALNPYGDGLVVYKYYVTLTAAVEGELSRLKAQIILNDS